jgi:rod shape-determining protein MreC
MLATVVLLNLPLPVSMRVRAHARDNVAPFQNVMSLLVHKTRAVIEHLSAAGRAAANVESKQQEIERLSYQLERLKVLKDENRLLRHQLGFRDSSERNLIAAEVVGRGDTSGWWQSLRLNRGLDEGVRTNAAVVAAGGLVGRTTVVSDSTCEVLLVTDPQLRLSARLPRTGALGIVRGSGVSLLGREEIEMLCVPEPPDLTYVPKHADIAVGDRVITSGLGGLFPEGIPVGYVVTKYEHKSGLYLCATLRPVVELATLKYAFVVVE